MKSVLLPTAYLGNVEYYSIINQYDKSEIEVNETYPKQTYRNRCTILGANGALDLVIPVKKKSGEKTLTKDIEIAYSEDWQRVHSYAIKSAYNSSPFFEFYFDYFQPFYQKEFNFLIDFNMGLHEVVMKALKLKKEIRKTDDFVMPRDHDDYRFSISPKKPPQMGLNEYYQVFLYKSSFVENMSIIDLVFNEGPRSQEFL